MLIKLFIQLLWPKRLTVEGTRIMLSFKKRFWNNFVCVIVAKRGALTFFLGKFVVVGRIIT